MRHFHYMQNPHWSRPINVDKLWTLVPKEEKDGLTADSDVVPVIDVLAAGYTKVLGNGLCVCYLFSSYCKMGLNFPSSFPKLPCIVKARFVSARAEYVYYYYFLVRFIN